MQSIGFIGPGVALLCLNFAKTPEVASVLITIALSFSAFSQAGFLLNMQVRQHNSIEYTSITSQANIDALLWKSIYLACIFCLDRILHLSMLDFYMVCICTNLSYFCYSKGSFHWQSSSNGIIMQELFMRWIIIQTTTITYPVY